jgi:hypothetical protein
VWQLTIDFVCIRGRCCHIFLMDFISLSAMTCISSTKVERLAVEHKILQLGIRKVQERGAGRRDNKKTGALGPGLNQELDPDVSRQLADLHGAHSCRCRSRCIIEFHLEHILPCTQVQCVFLQILGTRSVAVEFIVLVKL